MTFGLLGLVGLVPGLTNELSRLRRLARLRRRLVHVGERGRVNGLAILRIRDSGGQRVVGRRGHGDGHRVSVLSYVTPSALPATCTSVYSYVPAASNGIWSKVTVPSAAFVVVPGIHHVRSRKENVSDLRDTVGATAYGHVGDNNDAGMDLSTSKYKNPAELST